MYQQNRKNNLTVRIEIIFVWRKCPVEFLFPAFMFYRMDTRTQITHPVYKLPRLRQEVNIQETCEDENRFK